MENVWKTCGKLLLFLKAKKEKPMKLNENLTLKEIYEICYKESPCEECRFGLFENGHNYAECIFALHAPAYWSFKEEENE